MPSPARFSAPLVAHQTGLRYVDADGIAVSGEAMLARIKALAIPAAWIEVWICLWNNGHIHALSPEEAAVVGLLQQRLQQSADTGGKRLEKRSRKTG